MPINVDFIGLNTFLNEPISSSNGQNTIGFPTGSSLTSYENVRIVRIASGSTAGAGDTQSRRAMQGQASLFHVLNTKRNGPYGYSSWQQLRVSQNPLTRYQNKNSDFTFVVSPGNLGNISADLSKEKLHRNKYSKIYQYEEPAVSSKTYPLAWSVGAHELIRGGKIVKSFSVKSSYANYMLGFSNEKVNKLLKIDFNDDELEYNIIKDLYLDGGLDAEDSPITEWDFLRYRETVFPQARNAYRKENRNRQNFVSFYRVKREDRRTRLYTSSFGNVFQKNPAEPTFSAERQIHISQSSWPLDPEEDWSTRAWSATHYIPEFSASGVVHERSVITAILGGPGHQGAGILMNNYSQFNVDLFDPLLAQSPGDTEGSSYFGIDFNMGIGPNYSRRHTLRFTGSFSNPSGFANHRTSSVAADLDKEMFRGNALWEAGTQAGKSPFPDTYDDFNKIIRLKAKDYSLVPEYRISNHVENILKSGSLYFGTDLFEITGGEANNHNSSFSEFYKTYSNSDFMKHFDVLNSDHEDFANSKILTLRCKVIKKFLPYEGFYPCQRTVQCTEQFKRSYLDFMSQEAISTLVGVDPAYPFMQTANQPKQILVTPLFSPGILFNSIKSGLAVDFPVYTNGTSRGSDPYNGDDSLFTKDIDGTAGDAYLLKKNFNETWTINMTGNPAQISGVSSEEAMGERIPFEALVNPEYYMSQKTFRSIEPHPSGNLSASAGWSGQGDNLYRMMMNNFLGEVPNFFLNNESFSSIASRKQSEFKPVEADRTYSMRVKMYRTMDGKKAAVSSSNGFVYYPPQDVIIDPSSTNKPSPRENFTMYSRPTAFGPPSLGITKYHIQEDSNLDQMWYGDRIHSTGSKRDNVHMDSRHGFNFPYTPPYYHGEAWMDIHVRFSTGGRKTLDEIFSQIQQESTSSSNKITQLRAYDVWSQGHYITTASQGVGPQSFYNNNINKNACQLTASLNIFGEGALKSTDLLDDDSNQEINLVVNTQQDDEKRWVVQTKFETPMLNFNHLKDSGGTNPNITLNSNFGEASVPVGMWHQYGRIPNRDEGVYIQITDIPHAWVRKTTTTVPGAADYDAGSIEKPYRSKRTGSLAEVCGFTNEPIKLGQVASSKTIREAVVAIPYIQKAGRKKFFKLDANSVQTFLTPALRNSSEIGLSIKQQLLKMKKYVFPPSFDFIRNRTVDPIAMYIFEFSHKLGQQDLADIWQNLPPSGISERYEESTAVVSHPLLQKELLGTGESGDNSSAKMPSELRWMVFKVKQRANGNYFKKVFSKDSNLGATETKRISRVAVDEFGNTMDVQYNWPYDYFSLVELIKLEAEVEFNNVDFTNFKEKLPEIESVKAQPHSVNMLDADIDEKYIAFAETDAHDYTSVDDDDVIEPQSGADPEPEMLEQLEEDFAELQADILDAKFDTGGIAGGTGVSGRPSGGWGGGQGNAGPACFVAGTEISISNGKTKNIESIQVGDIIETYNLKSKIIELKKVVKLIHHSELQEIYNIEFSNGMFLQNTDSHPYYTKDKGYVSIKDGLSARDTVFKQINGEMVLFTIASINKTKVKSLVYNFEAEDNHNYFAKGILVHNKGGSSGISSVGGAQEGLADPDDSTEALGGGSGQAPASNIQQ